MTDGGRQSLPDGRPAESGGTSAAVADVPPLSGGVSCGRCGESAAVADMRCSLAGMSAVSHVVSATEQINIWGLLLGNRGTWLGRGGVEVLHLILRNDLLP